MSRRSNWGGGRLLVGLVVMAAGATAGCRDDDDVVRAAGGKASATGAAGRHGEDGAAPGGGVAGSVYGGGAGGTAGLGGAAGAAGSLHCDCGSDVNDVKIPLDCACEAGLCTTFAQDLPVYRAAAFGEPYLVVLGTCASGYRTLSFEEALEEGGSRTYDSQGRMVYDSRGPYNGVVPDACGFGKDFLPWDVTIGGDDPAKACTYCVIAKSDDFSGLGAQDDAGGTGGVAGAPQQLPYPDWNTPSCDPSLFE